MASVHHKSSTLKGLFLRFYCWVPGDTTFWNSTNSFESEPLKICFLALLKSCTFWVTTFLYVGDDKCLGLLPKHSHCYHRGILWTEGQGGHISDPYWVIYRLSYLRKNCWKVIGQIVVTWRRENNGTIVCRNQHTFGFESEDKKS